VKIPIVLSTMIATRAPRVSLNTGVRSLNDTWVRTKPRLGWAISPETAGAWLQAAAKRFGLRDEKAAMPKAVSHPKGMSFTVSPEYPEAVRLFLQGSTKKRGDNLAEAVQNSLECFQEGPDGLLGLHSVMNSHDLTSPPSKDQPENDAFKSKVKAMFGQIVEKQMEIERSMPYSSFAIEHQLGDIGHQDAWVIGAKRPEDPAVAGGEPLLSIGDTLVQQLLQRPQIGDVWSTSRSTQDNTGNHRHFSVDLNSITREEFGKHMQQIDEERRGKTTPLTVFFIFGNTGGNCELNPKTGRTLNSANIDTPVKFLDAAKQQGWLTNENVRFVVVSSFHCSPERSKYNDRLQRLPSVDEYGPEDSEAYKAALTTQRLVLDCWSTLPQSTPRPPRLELL